MNHLLSFLANLLLFLSIATLAFSVAAFTAFKIKRNRKPKEKPAAIQTTGANQAAKPELLQLYQQPAIAPVHQNDSVAATSIKAQNAKTDTKKRSVDDGVLVK